VTQTFCSSDGMTLNWPTRHPKGDDCRTIVMENFRKFSQVETFLTMFAHCFLLAYFSPYYLCFYSIIYDSGKFPEIFITTEPACQQGSRAFNTKCVKIKCRNQKDCNKNQIKSLQNLILLNNNNFKHPHDALYNRHAK
jgi:hypothetical protein